MGEPRKKFDCLGMKHAIQQEIAEETRNLSWNEERAYYQKQIAGSTLAEKWKALQKQQREKSSRK